MKTNDFPRVGDFTPACTSPLTTEAVWSAGWSAAGRVAAPLQNITFHFRFSLDQKDLRNSLTSIVKPSILRGKRRAGFHPVQIRGQLVIHYFRLNK